MKKAVVTILAVLYFITSTGTTIQIHYCMGKLISWKVNPDEKTDICSKCGMKSKKGCCEEKYQVIKIDQDQKKVNPITTSINSPQIILHNYYTEFSYNYFSNSSKETYYNHAPPLDLCVPIYISNCVFRI